MDVETLIRICESSQDEVETHKLNPYECEMCKGSIILYDGSYVCESCGIVYERELRSEIPTKEEILINYYTSKKRYSRLIHLSRVIKKLNSTRRTTKDDLDFPTIIKKYDIKKTDTIDVLKAKIKDYNINHYCILNYLHPSYIFIDYILQRRIFSIYNKITKIYYREITPKTNRKNFLNNYYVLKKILLMLRRKDISDKIQSLKVKSNINKYNAIWKSIMDYY